MIVFLNLFFPCAAFDWYSLQSSPSLRPFVSYPHFFTLCFSSSLFRSQLRRATVIGATADDFGQSHAAEMQLANQLD